MIARDKEQKKMASQAEKNKTKQNSLWNVTELQMYM